MAEPADTRYRDVTTLSRGGKWLFGGIAAFQLGMFVPLAFSMGPAILLAGLPGAAIAAGLVLLWGVLRVSVGRDEVVFQQGLRERRVPLADVAAVRVDDAPTEHGYVMPASRDGRGNETFVVFGSRTMVEVELRSGARIRVMSEAPRVLADAIEVARSAITAPVPHVRVEDPDAEHEALVEDEVSIERKKAERQAR